MPLFPAFFKYAVYLFSRFPLSVYPDNFKSSFRNINFNQIVLFYQCNRTALRCFRRTMSDYRACRCA